MEPDKNKLRSGTLFSYFNINQVKPMTIPIKISDSLNEEVVDDPKSDVNSLVGINADHKQDQWPPVWSLEQWLERKSKHPWLICLEQKLGCIICREVGCLKTFKKQGVELSKEWISCMVDSGKHSNKKTRLASLRNKIKRHAESSAHLFACSVKGPQHIYCNVYYRPSALP